MDCYSTRKEALEAGVKLSSLVGEFDVYTLINKPIGYRLIKGFYLLNPYANDFKQEICEYLGIKYMSGMV